MAKEQSTYDKIELVLFKGHEEIAGTLSPRELAQKDRWMLCVSKKIADPIILDSELVNFLTTGCGGVCEYVSPATAYRDIAAINRLVGNVSLASKNWYRHMIIESSKKGIEIAKSQNDAKGIAANTDKIGKYTRADKDDEAFDYGSMIPPSFEPSDDVTLLGDDFVSIPNLEEVRKEFRDRFKNDKSIMNAEYEEVVVDGSESK